MINQGTSPIAILGAGSWGSALGLYLSRRGQTVHIWSIDQTEISDMLRDGANERYLPGHPLPETFKPNADLASVVSVVKDILIVVPSVGFKSTLQQLKPLLKASHRFISATKGIDSETGELTHEMFETILGNAYPFAALSGPSFAKEVAAGLPTAVIIASLNKKFRSEIINRFHSPIFHAYPSDDISGVELGGVCKNIIAIATGISDGLQLGSNARSALITCGLSEITKLGIALGADVKTFSGLAGIGDLILTCSDDQSRNRRFGLALGKGLSFSEASKSIGQVVEGKRNAELVYQLALKKKVKMPITQLIADILNEKISIEIAKKNFLNSC